MEDKQKIEDINREFYDFRYEETEENTFRLESGLTPEIVTKISDEKGDPDWMREFRLKSGSSISFHGDPMAASLDIAATYSVNANLTDLDESFANDKDLNRTQVPVNALLKLTGAKSQPDISFDLEFPTLTQDVYRKVLSIINTDDMMTQQMIYLLALNRF